MCGIIGYIGKKQASPILLESLRRLEYRGYDSAGLAVLQPSPPRPGEAIPRLEELDGRSKLHLFKKKGKIGDGLGRLIQQCPPIGQLGIGHTRWATHGRPSDQNSHPHLDGSGRIAVVHNGVIENFDRLKPRLEEKGHQFNSETDTEVLAHLIGDHYMRLRAEQGAPASNPALDGRSGDSRAADLLTQAVTQALREVIGAYGIAVLCSDAPGVIVGARRGSPLIIGVGQDENFLASDANAIVAHTRRVVYLNDYDIVTLRAGEFDVTSLGTDTATVQISQIEFSPEAAERGRFAHFMLKEIFEQPETVANCLRGRLDFDEATAKFGGLNLSSAELRNIDRVVMTACGTSWHAALVGEYLFEELAHIPVEVEYASEFRYRNAPLEKNTLVLAITQSGETADTLAGLREARRRGHKVLALCNVVGSTIARESDGGIYLHAGPEIGVASTKAFTSQVTALTLLALHMARMRVLPPSRGSQLLRELEQIPGKIEAILAQNDAIQALAVKYAEARNFFFLGRQYNFPVALEGALKLKEISYIHAEGYPAAEMKHGPIALIEPGTPSVFLIPSDCLYEKALSNLQVIRARQGPVIAVANRDNPDIAAHATDVIPIPATLDPLTPLLSVVPLQLLAYHIALLRGCDVDKPRNLAKSVTVE